MRPPPLVSGDRLDSETPSSVRSSETRTERGFECDICAQRFDGEPAGSGLFIWSRGTEVRYEQPPLCEECASKVTLGALLSWDSEEEEEG